MENRKRERVALAIFLVLVTLGGLLLAAYFLTGRSWSVAATMVDDTMGSLDRYTVVAFSGVIPEGKLEAAEESSGSSASSSASGSSSSSSSAASASASEHEVGPEFTMMDAFGESPDQPGEIGIGDSVKSVFEREDRRASSHGDDVYVSDVRDLYSMKGADGVTLSLSDLSKYADPVVLSAGTKKVGVFSAASYVSRAKLKSIVETLKDDGADTIVCIVPRTPFLSTYDGIDVVALASAPDGPPDERDTGDTLVVQSPEAGDVGVVILSSNNVPTYKVVKEL